MPMGFEGPIPGENYTSDTKNYAWHRPPEFTNLDKAIEYVGKKLMTDDTAYGLLTMIESGMDVATLTDMFITAGIGSGKWTVDLGLLLAGPTSHIICLMCKAYDIDYDMGLSDKIKSPSSAFFNGLKMADKSKVKKAVSEVKSEGLEEVKEEASKQKDAGGFMSMGKKKEEGEY